MLTTQALLSGKLALLRWNRLSGVQTNLGPLLWFESPTVSSYSYCRGLGELCAAAVHELRSLSLYALRVYVLFDAHNNVWMLSD